MHPEVVRLFAQTCGIDVVALEKHTGSFRDSRGDTVNPPTLQVTDELGLVQAS